MPVLGLPSGAAGAAVSVPITAAMPRLRVPVAAVLTTVLAASVPAAAAGTPNWSSPQILSDSGATVAQMSDPTQNNRIAASPDGSVTVAWVQSDGSNDRVVARRYSAATRTWTTAGYASGAGEDVYAFATSMDDDGNASIVWYATTGLLRTSTLLAGDQSWSTPLRIQDEGESLTGGGFGAGPGGRTVAAYTVDPGGAPALKIRLRDRNSANWAAATTIALDPSLSPSGQVTIAFNATGDGALEFYAYDGSQHHVYLLRYDHVTHAWSSTPQEVASSDSDFNGMSSLAIAPDGSIAVAYETSDMTPFVRTITAGGELGPERALGQAGSFRVLPQVVADDHDRFVAVWQTITSFDPIQTTVEYTTGTAGGSWDDDAYTPSGATAGGPSLVATHAGDVVLGYAETFAPITSLTYRTTRWSSSGRNWSTPSVAEDGRATASNGMGGGAGSLPRIAIDGQGHTFAMWSDNSSSPFGIGFAVLDTVAPQITSVQVPTRAETGTDVAVAVAARDIWSDVGSVSWDFGDEQTGEGPSAHHRYAAAGDYTVRVTVTDAAGNARTVTRTIAVDEPDDGDPDPAGAPTPTGEPDPVDAPAPSPKTPPRTLPEARLSGKTLTLNAVVSTPLSRCKGRATVSYSLPGRRYSASVTLVRSGGRCRAVGTIRLAPATLRRTTVRLTVRGSKIRTRTVTARRR